ncbi:nucleotidyltransferase [Caenimonas sedimenti]|uniref:Nucleotidyltransferase n=1 Tax=Caenimonas sedimenti TaxID=2596921 RepID=A0A562ZNT5_9BURK|nr:nucleotidyltransferase [Caenimonas sedimenti]TWO70026.1 nucleotidyltransferase [Caenimonas sedimenti]
MRIQAPPQFNLQALASRIQPQEAALSAARSHRGSVRLRLAKTFQVANATSMGSHARQTAVHRYSDLDFMVQFRKDEFFWGGRLVSSDTILDRLLNDLRERFPNTSIRRDIVAASLDFSSGQSLDVVPARFDSFSESRPVYLIPDGTGGWLRTSPQAHDQYFEVAHERSGRKLRRVSQLLKWWKHGREQALPIRSFYIDMVLASTDVAGVARTYGTCLRDFFEHLLATECRPIHDPCGIAGRISANETYAQLSTLNRAAQFAQMHARSALAAEAKRDFPEANRQWSLVFNGSY